MNFIIPIAAPAGRAHASKGAGPAPVSPGAPEAPAAAWQAAVIRLANTGERVCNLLGWVLEHNQDNDPASVYAENVRELVEALVDYLDGIDPDPDLEDGGDEEPCLGSHELEPAGAMSYLPSWARVAGYDVEEQCDDEGISA